MSNSRAASIDWENPSSGMFDWSSKASVTRSRSTLVSAESSPNGRCPRVGSRSGPLMYVATDLAVADEHQTE